MHLIFSNAAGKNCVLPEKIVFEIIFRPEFNRHFVPTAQVRMSFFRQLFEYCCYVIDGILKNKKKKKRSSYYTIHFVIKIPTNVITESIFLKMR